MKAGDTKQCPHMFMTLRNIADNLGIDDDDWSTPEGDAIIDEFVVEHADDASLVDGELYYKLPLKESLCPDCYFNKWCDYYSEDEDEDEDEE
jgi:hypothetical protein